MKSLEKRLAERKANYEKLVEYEILAQHYIDKILTVVPESVNLSILVYSNYAYISMSFDNIEDFEELYITRLSELLNITWIRHVGNSDVIHSASIVENKYHTFLTSVSKPTDSCRIKKIPTGRTIKTQKFVEVEEAEFDYLVECSDD